MCAPFGTLDTLTDVPEYESHGRWCRPRRSPCIAAPAAKWPGAGCWDKTGRETGTVVKRELDLNMRKKVVAVSLGSAIAGGK